jgi:apolipoprotein N-acyltransferase
MPEPAPSPQPSWVLLSVGATLSIALLAWLWVGRAPGARKRVAFRFALLGLTVFLLWLGRSQGIFAQSTPAFTVALGAIVALVMIGNLYAVRFCNACGRMHRNFKTLKCARCFAVLPRHGFTDEPRRPPLDPLDPLGRRKPAGRRSS